MAGHSKWKQIKRAKGVTDAKRGQAFTKLAREITVAARLGLPDPDANFRLRIAIQKARAENMPNDNIKRAIDRAAGNGDADNFDEIYYEGYGPNGIAVMLKTLTDNRNRTVGEIRAVFTRAGGALGESGSVGYLFDQVGLITVNTGRADIDELSLMAIDAGAEDIRTDGDEETIGDMPPPLRAEGRAGRAGRSGAVDRGCAAHHTAQGGAFPPEEVR
ncbi:MAG: YebC/PmpR family DNA-binding transcriptional regulator [Thermomicrobiales bacterium]